ncbi:MAG: hypothetical protein KBA31_12025 [Alphaproteobacteria bacterium]|nr:hypothetical protein [Alphaproteobacteria bacterium]
MANDPTKKRAVMRYVLLGAAVLLFLGVFLLAWRQLSIDSCLDRGGAWNYELGNCEM